MLDAINALLKVSKPTDEFQLNYIDLQQIIALLQDYESLKEKYRLLLTQVSIQSSNLSG